MSLIKGPAKVCQHCFVVYVHAFLSFLLEKGMHVSQGYCFIQFRYASCF